MSAERRLPSCLTDPGLIPVCVDCGEPIESGEPRVTVRDPARPKAPWLRCAACEYAVQMGEAAQATERAEAF